MITTEVVRYILKLTDDHYRSGLDIGDFLKVKLIDLISGNYEYLINGRMYLMVILLKS